MSSFHVPLLSYAPQIVFKKCIVSNFVLTSARNLSNFIKAIYIFASERSCYALSENGIVYCAMSYYLRDISACSWRIMSNFCWVSIFFDNLIVNFSWTVAQTPANHRIFWKSVMRTFRRIFANCFNRLRFLLRSAQNCKKHPFSGHFKDHYSGRKHVN